ncbi:MAG: hypothetical protein K0S57_76 [Ramlibacter sp.]|jgi:hypothetical protein|nr:hypothetical protein [Ramlibacter sp.]
MQADPDEVDRMTSEVITRFASSEGARLRKWMAAFRDRQAVPAARESAAAAIDLDSEAVLDDGILRDGEGRPQPVDVATFLDSLAYWVASRRPPKPWQRSPLLNEVATRSRELADLLEQKDGPEWPLPFDLFETSARPRFLDGSFADYRRDVRDPLRRQNWPGLLRNLAAEANRLERLSRIDTAVLNTPRPTAPGAWERRLAREIRDWFQLKCRTKAPPELIADVINLGRTRALRSAREDVTGAEVTQWLRSPRPASKKPAG